MKYLTSFEAAAIDALEEALKYSRTFIALYSLLVTSFENALLG